MSVLAKAVQKRLSGDRPSPVQAAVSAAVAGGAVAGGAVAVATYRLMRS